MLASSDERVCFDARRHGVVLARPLSQSVVLAVSGAVLLWQPWPLQLPGAALVVALTFAVEPGRITGFLGPNGAGKTTTLRMLLGLVHPSAGQALVDGAPYRKLVEPVRTVGVVLEASSYHPTRSGRNHLRVLAT